LWAFIHAGQTRLQCNFGHSVYDFAHIGNFRAYICSDILKRYLEYKGFKVKHVMNITDVDDKTIKGANKEGISLNEYTERYEKAFFEDITTLNIDKADVYPRATEHINEMVGIIKKLMKKGAAYKSDDGSVYYDISKFNDYGKLSHIKIKSLKEGARVRQDSYEKEEAKDFALWKAYDKEDGNAFWETVIEFEVSSEEYGILIEQAIKNDDLEFLELNKIEIGKLKRFQKNLRKND